MIEIHTCFFYVYYTLIFFLNPSKGSPDQVARLVKASPVDQKVAGSIPGRVHPGGNRSTFLSLPLSQWKHIVGWGLKNKINYFKGEPKYKPNNCLSWKGLWKWPTPIPSFHGRKPCVSKPNRESPAEPRLEPTIRQFPSLFFPLHLASKTRLFPGTIIFTLIICFGFPRTVIDNIQGNVTSSGSDQLPGWGPRLLVNCSRGFHRQWTEVLLFVSKFIDDTYKPKPLGLLDTI